MPVMTIDHAGYEPPHHLDLMMLLMLVVVVMDVVCWCQCVVVWCSVLVCLVVTVSTCVSSMMRVQLLHDSSQPTSLSSHRVNT